MSQSDYDISNASGASVRADINNALLAIVSQNSGSSAPGTTFAHMWWFDTSNNLLKQRNAANDAWVTVASKVGNVWVPYSEGIALTAGEEVGDLVRLESAGDTAATPTLPPVDARNLVNVPSSSTISIGTPVDAASGSPTAIDFTSIPAGVKRVTMNFAGISTNGSSVPIVQIGDSGGIETTNYLGSAVTQGISTANLSSGFALQTSHAAASVFHGRIVLDLLDAATNTWTAQGMIGMSDTNATALVAGSKALSATLDRIRLTTAAGSDNFDAGKVNILYEQ